MSSLNPLINNKIKPKANNYGTNNTKISQDTNYYVVGLHDSDIFSDEMGESSVVPTKSSDRVPSQEESNFLDVVPYYLPCFLWLPQYSWPKFFGDLIAGISLASFQIPLALSYATSLAHVEPLCGLYSLAITPFFYAIFGSVPCMIVGPESALSLVMGQTIEKLVSHSDDMNVISLSAVITFIAGAILLAAGICRIGFLGSILSRALLRGFISSVGFVMVVNSLISELRLNKILSEATGHHHTAFKKIIFIIENGPQNYHKPTAILSISCFSILMIIRFMKRRMMSKYKWVVLFPEILIVVIVTILLSAKMKLKKRYGIPVIGDFNTEGMGKLINPISESNRGLFGSLHSVGIIIALLGFFESTTTSKSLGGLNNSTVSSNRELVALGIMNMGASLFGALPAFGGYGRSKINQISGAQTAVSGVCLGFVTLFTIRFLLPAIHYIPVCVLSVITTLVGVSLLEEAPNDIMFHIRCHGYNELIIFFLTFLTTIFYSVDIGISIGCIYSIISIIKRAAKSRIQILAKVEGIDHFVNADEYQRHHDSINSPETLNIEHFEGCLVVKIPEPLTFNNTEDLKERLVRLERFGSVNIHPGRRDIRERDTLKCIVFDLKGMTFIDSSAVQILKEIISEYTERNVKVLLTRVPFNREVRQRLEGSNINNMVVKTGTVTGNIPNIPTGQLVSAQIELSPYFSNIEEALFKIETTNI